MVTTRRPARAVLDLTGWPDEILPASEDGRPAGIGLGCMMLSRSSMPKGSVLIVVRRGKDFIFLTNMGPAESEPVEARM